jgi:DNA-binding NarL/FixJ family response regulator
MNKINVILVDDHQIVRDGIKSLLSGNDKVKIIGEAENAEDFFDILKIQIPDIVLLDISLPTLSGIEIAKILNKEFAQIKILMLSMYSSEDFIFNALKAGIHGYLPKNTTQKELLLAINTVYNDEEYFSKNIADTILKSYVNNAKQKNEEANLNTLTNREREVLQYIIEGNNNTNISEQLNISIRTVETHKTNIMKKLNLNSAVDLVKFAIKNNLINL